MSSLKYAGIRAAFELLWASQLTGLIRALSRCRGVIFTLHRVVPDRPADFSPNAILQVTPDFLEFTIARVRELGFDIVSLDEGIRRLTETSQVNRFVVFTFDDAYRDNLQHALPVLRRRNCPFTLYVPTAFVDGVGDLWWQAIEDIISTRTAIGFVQSGESIYLDTVSVGQKEAAYKRLYWLLRGMQESERLLFLKDFFERYEFDSAVQCRELIMDWTDLKTFAEDPLCTIGAHTVHHYELSKLSAAQARNEISESVKIIASQLGKAPEHLSYPLGGPHSAAQREFEMATELGLKSGVTTRPGGLYYAHRKELTSLPRISLNGLFQENRYVDVFATGAIFSSLPGGG
jgi:peptidoglycan/xylan/chitin deacetylase (PgdA/CDA1 family)